MIDIFVGGSVRSGATPPDVEKGTSQMERKQQQKHPRVGGTANRTERTRHGAPRKPERPQKEAEGQFAQPTYSPADGAVKPYDSTDGIHGSYENGAVIGRNAVRELLRTGRPVDKLLVQKGERTGSIVVLVAQAIERGIPIVETEKAKLDTMAGFAPHQGVIALAAQKEYCTVEDILKLAKDRGEAPLIVLCDGVTDPYNLGAIIRCAECCGAHGLIIPKRRATGLTPLVSKASAGAIEHLAIAKVANIASAVERLKKEGIWVYAAEAGGTSLYETDFSGPCAIVMGSEGAGVSQLVRKTCDAVVSIPIYGRVNSFNVSTAAAILLAEAARKHRKQG